ncbi:MAG: DUF596 domain-containing protein [Ralstonia sp.]|uniref:Uncharacterized protein n=1 Tax=Ralstonia pickettii TaxID=329 RepID=A0AAW4QEA9_RALPI|nr:DUF596 domain-containing protein [Ralstonia pickettii]MBX3756624.1 hypothetical protein [Ralstonia pickettii]MBX3769299.1 hypothetical protein [Ralstonia pickettii]MBX3780253.1 hypothetical protein [Ralstonia pickettii]MBX3785353.1 hypothetical protein [Ralstonia pickettii]MBX3790851.1 hypothetical protein [Ralstonia pickettii]
MLTEDQYNFIAGGCEGMELDAIWDYFSVPFGSKFMPHQLDSFESRREGFLWVVGRLLNEGQIVLVDQRTRSPLPRDSGSQVALLRRSFPKEDAAMDGGLWLLSTSCPGGAAWKAKR